MLFIGGACTLGPGQVVSTNLEERIRSHQELQGGTAPHYANADKFYDWLATRLVKNGHCMDVFACALDQVGLCEMRHCWERTGGCLVNHEAFKGGVILVSHDQYFVGRVAKEVWLVAKGAVKKVESFDKYRDYQLKKLAPMVVEVS